METIKQKLTTETLYPLLTKRLAKEIVIRSVPAPLEIEPIKKQICLLMWQCYPFVDNLSYKV